MSTNARNDAIQQLLRYFGNQLDRDVLESVLELNNGNVQHTIDFLKVANNNDYTDPYANQPAGQATTSNLPRDYMDKPAGWQKPIDNKAAESASAAVEKGGADARSTAEKYKAIFLNEQTTVTEHINHLKDKANSYPFYVSALTLMLDLGIELASSTKTRVLAACWSLNDFALANHLLTKHSATFTLPEVTKALKILDAPRRIRQLEKKIQTLVDKRAKNSRIGPLRSTVNDLRRECVETLDTTVTGALLRRVRKWVSIYSREELEFYLLQLSRELWQDLSDTVHFGPKDFKLEWFLPVVFGGQPPEDSLLAACANIGSKSPEEVLTLVRQHKVPYSFLRKKVADALTNEVRIQVARYEKLDTIVWYYEEFTSQGATNEINTIISERIDAGEVPQFSYGKLMERMLYFKLNNASFYQKLIPIAEARLRQISLPLDPPIVVLGDASYSMDVSIRVSTILASLLTALANAELRFFNVRSIEPHVMPRTIPQVLDVATKTKADGLTAPACTLFEYYNQRKIVKFFVIVTDEIENEKSNNNFFAQLFYKYYTEVYPANICMVSFLENPSEKGRMVKSLENLGITPLQFRLDQTRPDLTKVDSMLAILSTLTTSDASNFFTTQVQAMAKILKTENSTLTDAIQYMERSKLERSQDRARMIVEQTPAADEEARPILKEKGKAETPTVATTTTAATATASKKTRKAGDEVPDEFICPITCDIMENPVVAADGHTYDKEAIEEWLRTKHTSPLTGEELSVKMVFPNFSLRSRIKEWQEQQPKSGTTL